MQEKPSLKTLVIIYPDWFPSNVAGVHRPRLIGNFLSDFGWKPKVVTVEEKFYTVKPDPDFYKTFTNDFEVIRVKALKRNRIIGDIGLRAFFQLYKKAMEIIENESIDFIWLPIPTFYTSLLGRIIYERSGIPYGIDYIDPWVRDLTNQSGLRAGLSQSLARFLEPVAIKKAALISGVSTPYYEPVIKRNFPEFYNDKGKLLAETINRHTKQKMVHVGMPYGFDPNDHQVKLENLEYPWKDDDTHTKRNWIYAGAFLPNSHLLLEALFHAIKNLRDSKQWDDEIRLWFVGTGQYPAKSIESYAKDYGITDIVTEHRERYPFLKVLNFLAAADTVMIVGSTEKHYTASKTFQALLSHKPVVSVFHQESSAVKVMEDCKADRFTLRYDPELRYEELVSRFEEILKKRLTSSEWSPDLTALEKYSAKASAEKLVEAINKVINRGK